MFFSKCTKSVENMSLRFIEELAESFLCPSSIAILYDPFS